MKTIWKYELPAYTPFDLSMPKDAKIMDFKTQNNTPVIWALVDTDAELEHRAFAVYTTGEIIPEDAVKNTVYHGTVLFTDDTIGSHLFEIL